jgi:hypothetical protein
MPRRAQRRREQRARSGEEQQVERRDHARNPGLRPEDGVPGRIADEPDRRDDDSRDRVRVTQRDTEEDVQLRLRLLPAEVVPAVEEEPEDHPRPAECGDQVLAPE